MGTPLDFFQIGGTLSQDAPSYIERPADADLLIALERHQYCLVLAPRQMGKSSLMVHALARLREKGITSAVVDLQPLGSEGNIDRWFVSMIYQIERTARLRSESREWWVANSHLGPTQRFMAFLEEVALSEIEGDLALFFDEIDSVFGLPFSDDFFTTIRSLYNSRSVNPSLRRLSIVLLGVATASSFIKDRTRTPFNIGESIILTDFSRDRTAAFEEVLGQGSEQIIDRIFYWTGGQPLLVQKLAAAAYSMPSHARSAEQIDDEVRRSYFQLKIEQDTHLKFIQDYVLERHSNVRKTLSTYRDILEHKNVENDERSSSQGRLKLAGLVRARYGSLVPRNRIYEWVFNLEWVKEHLPPDRRIHIAAAFALVTLVLAFASLTHIYSSGAGDVAVGDRPLRVGIVTWPGYAGGLVANNGFKPNRDCIFWNKYNIQVEFFLLEDVDVRDKLFLKGGRDGVDICWSSVDYWANELPGFVREGISAKAIMQVDWSRGGDAIVADNSIQRIEDLKGKKISLALFTESHWLLEYSLENSSIDPSDQEMIVKNLVGRVSSPDARADFVAHKVDAAVIWEPDVTEALQKRPNSHILVSSKTAANLIADVMVAREDFIQGHVGVIKSFVKGWFDGTEEANRNPDRVTRLLMDDEPLYKDLGESVTRDSLSTVKWADLADNIKMFGLDDKEPMFDRIFREASQAWVRRGYISQAVTPDKAKEDRFIGEIQAATPIEVPKPEFYLPEAPPDVEGKEAVVTKPINIYFAQGSSELDPNAQQLLDQVALLVQTYSNAYIRVEGNTDNLGSREANTLLSEHRAQAVVDALAKRYGFNRQRFIAVGNGPNKPIASNSTLVGRAANRRTDIAIVPR